MLPGVCPRTPQRASSLCPGPFLAPLSCLSWRSYETRASEILSQIKSWPTARQLLTAVQTVGIVKRPVYAKTLAKHGINSRSSMHLRPGDRVYMWPESIYDTAIDRNGKGYPCHTFLTHAHSVRLVESVFNGEYAGSRFVLTDGDPTAETAGTLSHYPTSWAIYFHVLTLGTLLALPQWLIWIPWLRCALRPCSVQINLQHGYEKDGTLDPRTHNIDPFFWQNSAAEADEGLSASSSCCLKWKHFWLVPKVRYTVHTLTFVLYLAALWTILITDSYPSRFVLEPSNYASMPTTRFESVCETFVWAYGVTRSLEEYLLLGMHMCAKGLWPSLKAHFSGLAGMWNYVDAAMTLVVLVGAAIRLVLHLRLVGEVEPPIDDNSEILEATLTRLLAALSVLASVRFLEVLCVFPTIGETVTILTKMTASLVPTGVIIVVVSVGFGTALQGLASDGGVPRDSSPYFWDSRLLLPFWALLGDFDKAELNEAYGLERSIMPPLLLWL
jgi:hypothetical protein